MLRLLSQTSGLAIAAQSGGELVGRISGWLIDPRTGALVAYQCGQRYLAVSDINGYARDAVIVGTPEVLQPINELVRIQALLPTATKLIGSRVVTDSGQRLGVSSEATFDTTSHLITAIHVRRTWWRWWQENLIIPRERIMAMAARQVVVRYDSRVPAGSVEPEIIP